MSSDIITSHEKTTAIDEKASSLEKSPTQPSETATVIEDAVFGHVTDEGPNYRGVSLKFSYPYLSAILSVNKFSWVGLLRLLS